MLHTHHRDIEGYITMDGSTIKELMHPSKHGNTNISLAEATIPPGRSTILHIHQKTEEIYHIFQGRGCMQVDKNVLEVEKGDTICIPQNTPHRITNTGEENLRLLCCCAPAYSHEDTILLEDHP
jgi:mannose-6-phosphate isomerase-like protein (cupin superfamily)